GTYLQFDGCQSRDDVTDHDPQRLLETVTKAYGRDSIEVRAYQRIEPVMLVRYEVGAELVVSDVRIERDTVRLFFGNPLSKEEGGEPATTLTVKWPTPLSRTLTERDTVEALLGQFVTLKTSR